MQARLRQIVWTGVALILCAAPLARAAASTDALIKRADTELRAAERKLFSGQAAAAQEQLASVAELLQRIEAAEASCKELPALKAKLARLRADVNRRIGTGASAAATPAAPAKPAVPAARPGTRAAVPAQPAAPATPASARPAAAAKLPYAVRETLREIDKQIRSIEYRLSKMEEAKQSDTTTAPQMYARETEKLISDAQALLQQAKAGAAAAGITSHPDLDAAQAKLDAYPARLKATSEGAAAAVAQRKAASTEIAGDIETVQKEVARLREKVFDKATGAAIYYNDLAPVKDLLAVIEDFEAHDKAAAQQLLDEFRAKYGATEDDIRQRTDDLQAVYAVRTLAEGIANVAKTRTAMAEDLATKIMQRVEGLGSSHDFARLARHAELRAWLAIAQAYDKEAPQVKELSERLETLLAEDAKKLEQKIGEQKWPCHAENAPENVKELAAAALAWFKSSPDWGARKADPAQGREPYRIVAVAVRGPWTVQARNLLGQTTMYGLPVLLAVQVPSEEKAGVVRVFSLTLRTREELGVKMAPPFDHVTVGDSCYMKASAIK